MRANESPPGAALQVENRVQLPSVEAAIGEARSWIDQDIRAGRPMPDGRYSFIGESQVTRGTYDIVTITDWELTGDKIHLLIHLVRGLRAVAAVSDYVRLPDTVNVTIQYPDLTVDWFRGRMERDGVMRFAKTVSHRHIRDGLDFPLTLAGWEYAVANDVWSPLLAQESPPTR